MGRADQTTKVKGMFVHPNRSSRSASAIPSSARLRLVVRRDGEQDAMTLARRDRRAKPSARKRVAATLQALTKLRGEVDFVAPGSLPNDGKIIADERPAP